MRTRNTSSVPPPVGRNSTWLTALGALAIVAAASLLSLSVASMIMGDVGGMVRSALMALILGTAGVVTVVAGRRLRAR